MFADLKDRALLFVEENATVLLTAGGVVGVVGTAVLSARAGIKAGRLLEARDQEGYASEVGYEPPSRTEDAKLVAVHFLPPVGTGTLTVGAIILSHRMSAQKAAALAAAYGIAEKHISEYKAKVEEKLTGPKQSAINEELAQEAIDRTPGHDRLVIIEGESLCFDKPNGRYFNSTMETIRQAVNTTNAEIHNHGFARLSFFYEELGLPETDWSDDVGFNSDNLLDLDFSTVLTPGNKPCIAFNFKRLPRTDFLPNY